MHVDTGFPMLKMCDQLHDYFMLLSETQCRQNVFARATYSPRCVQPIRRSWSYDL